MFGNSQPAMPDHAIQPHPVLAQNGTSARGCAPRLQQGTSLWAHLKGRSTVAALASKGCLRVLLCPPTILCWQSDHQQQILDCQCCLEQVLANTSCRLRSCEPDGTARSAFLAQVSDVLANARLASELRVLGYRFKVGRACSSIASSRGKLQALLTS